MMSLRCAILFIAVLCGNATAEFRRIDQKLSGMECASCSKAVTAAIQKMRGVESVTLEENLVRVQLKPDNRVRLDAIRDAVKGVGITPADATVEVRGKAISRNGRWEFEIEGLSQIAQISLDDKNASELRQREGQLLLIEGAVPAPPDPRTPLTLRVHAIRPDSQP